ncbi:hypothetical protein [Lentzea albidocapillata]|uniref:hypothetical protein n=1 Tax=Lentzea albidocapillata TaxID=40571 RepID=UPI0023EA5D12|nr:hypothetical protein [Lentzea albidocapillata]
MSADVYRVELDEPHADGTLTWRGITVVVSTVYADGASGVGWTYGSGGAADVIRDVLAPAIDLMSAISAVDIALWDLKAKTLGMPLSWLLGRVHTAVPVYGSGGFTSLARQAIGSGAQLFVDANGAYTAKQAVRIADRAAGRT